MSPMIMGPLCDALLEIAMPHEPRLLRSIARCSYQANLARAWLILASIIGQKIHTSGCLPGSTHSHLSFNRRTVLLPFLTK